MMFTIFVLSLYEKLSSSPNGKPLLIVVLDERLTFWLILFLSFYMTYGVLFSSLECMGCRVLRGQKMFGGNVRQRTCAI